MGLLGALAILRLGNATMAALGVAIGMLVVPGAIRHEAWLYLAPLSAAMVTAFGNVLNDVHDVEADRIAHPHRPLPSGRLGRTTAIAMAWVLGPAAIAIVYVPGDATLAIVAAATVALLLLYEARLKRVGLAGNVAVAILTATTFAFGALATTAAPAQWGGLWVLLAMAALANLGREIVKDIEDFDADLRRRRTLPHRTGPRKAALAAVLAVSVAVAINLGWLAATGLWDSPLGGLVGADMVLLAAAALAPSQPRTSQRALKLGMAVALVPYAIIAAHRFV